MQKIFQGLFILALGLAFGYFLGINKVNFEWKNYQPVFKLENKNPPKRTSLDFALFWDVWDKLTRNYVDKKAFDPQKMVYGAISGMVEALGDPYTVFLPPQENAHVKQQLSGRFEGIGAQLGIKDKRIVIIAPLANSPAQRAGIKSGDFILKVDGADTSKWSLYEAVAKIRGPKGTTVTLTILHEGEDKPQDLQIVRDTILVKSVEGKIDKNVAHIKLSQFGDETQSEWLITVNDLAKKIKENEVRGLVLDLRDNSGGYLNGAIFIASEFLEKGVVVIQEKGTGERQEFQVSRRGQFAKIPMAVLINKGSASASEIVAGALRDNKRAKIIGENSFGKGTIQEAQDLGEGAGLHITVARWLTPSGTWVNGKGLAPDIVVEKGEDPTRDPQLERAIEELVK